VKRRSRSLSGKGDPSADPSGSADGAPRATRATKTTRASRSSQSKGSDRKRHTDKKKRGEAKQDVKREQKKLERKVGTAPAKKPKPGKRRPSRSASAVRARKRRREDRGIRDQLAAERAERREVSAARAKEKKLGLPPDERWLAIGWLSQIRNVIAGVFPCSLDLTSPEAGARTPWIVVGRYEPQAAIGYRELATALADVASDLGLETDINPQRLSQIRIVYSDPRARRGEGDSIVSKIGAWEYIIADLVAEIVGSGPDDEDSLAVRYQETSVPKFYVYFSSTIVNYVTASAWQRVGMR
jgi:hypothetical protein